MDKKTFLQITAVILSCAAIFALFVFFITRTKALVGVSIPKNNVIYEENIDYPQDTTILLTFDDGYSLCLNFKFEEKFISAVIVKGTNESDCQSYGFYPTEKVHCSYSFVMKFIDKIDGIPLNIFGEEMRYTGVQICNILAVNKEHIGTKIDILKAVFYKINKIGFSSELLSCIINETENSLNVADCYEWSDYLGDMCNKYNIVNEG